MFYKDSDLKFLKPAPFLRELIILSVLEKNSSTSQAALSEKLGISVSMINKYISNFVNEGLLIFQGKTNRDTKYVLTVKGYAYKRDLLNRYMVETVKLYKDAKAEFQIKIQEFAESGINNVVFYGAGETAEIAITAAQEAGLRIIAVVDQKKEKQGKTINGILVVAPEMLSNMDFDGIVISSFGFIDEIYEKVKKYEERGKAVLKL